MRQLVVKMSALGDILQTFCVLPHLKRQGSVDWVVEKRFAALLRAQPLVDRVITIDSKRPTWDQLRDLRTFHYNTVYDLQGNCKSGLVTLLTRASKKIGFTFRQNAEWPNRLSLNCVVPIDENEPVRHHYLKIVGANKPESAPLRPQAFDSSLNEQTILICPGSNWRSKQLTMEGWGRILNELKNLPLAIVYQGVEEELFARELADQVGAQVVGDLSLPQLQLLMRQSLGVLSVDSCTLHLAIAASVPAFGLFGPSSGKAYGAFGAFTQGGCPFGQIFVKRCRHLRRCGGPCMDNLSLKAVIDWASALPQLADQNRYATQPN